MAEPLVKVSYYDPFVEFGDGDVTELNLTTVVGWKLPARFPGHIRIASERSTLGGWCCITHIPVDSVALIKEVQ